MIEIKADQRQLDRVQRKLTRFLRDMADRTAANRQVALQLYGWAIRNFDQEGALVGGWKPLAESTVREKERIGKQKMLVRTGELRQGFESFHSKDNAGIRNRAPHAEYHHEGGIRLPRRRLLPPREVVNDIGLKVYQAYVERAARRANS